MKRWLLNLLIWLDIGCNVLIFAGSPYETISSRVGKRREKGDGWACRLCALLDKIDARHCDKTRVPDIGENAPNWWKGLAIEIAEHRYLIAAVVLWAMVFAGFVLLWRVADA